MSYERDSEWWEPLPQRVRRAPHSSTILRSGDRIKANPNSGGTSTLRGDLAHARSCITERRRLLIGDICGGCLNPDAPTKLLAVVDTDGRISGGVHPGCMSLYIARGAK